MKNGISLGAALTSAWLLTAHAQMIDLANTQLLPSNAFVRTELIAGRTALVVRKDPQMNLVDEATFIRLAGVEFKNGTIELKVLSRLRSDAPDYARGFIGVAMRINEDNSEFEGIYLRPLNATAESQLQRNHSTQYFSYPGFKFDRSRQEAPGMYESYADIAMNEWISMKIVVHDRSAKLYLNGAKQPVLVVNDLKHGPDRSGGIGLWVDIGTEGYFSDLRIAPE